MSLVRGPKEREIDGFYPADQARSVLLRSALINEKAQVGHFKDIRKPVHLKGKRTRSVPTYEQWHWIHSGVHTWGHYRKPLQDMFEKYELFWTGEK